MKPATAEKRSEPVARITRPIPNLPAWIVTGPTSIAVRAGTVIENDGRVVKFDTETGIVIATDHLEGGTDFALSLGAEESSGRDIVLAVPATRHDLGITYAIGGFHFAPGSNASARTGGGDVPAINPCSCWDVAFRPSCADPRGMTYVAGVPGSESVKGFWADIYLLNVRHKEIGTSVFGETIADGNRNVPTGAKKLDYATAKAIYAEHGKGLLSFAEFGAAAYGVTEKTGPDAKPKLTGLDAPRTSRVGLMQATGNIYVWGHDGDPDEPRASLFGGNWGYGSYAGSRYASVDHWPDNSSEWFGARGRSDHFEAA